ncbi:hypothetical protein JW877_09955 [bacterium]|nr:hypothetical protein [bacterium]
MGEEHKKILNLLAEGKINADEAERLLRALDSSEEQFEREETLVIAKEKSKGKWLKIKVYENDLERPKVNIRIPLNLVKIAAKVGAKLNVTLPDKAHEVLAEKGITIEHGEELKALSDLVDALSEEAPFELVNVDDPVDREKVLITVE